MSATVFCKNTSQSCLSSSCIHCGDILNSGQLTSADLGWLPKAQ